MRCRCRRVGGCAVSESAAESEAARGRRARREAGGARTARQRTCVLEQRLVDVRVLVVIGVGRLITTAKVQVRPLGSHRQADHVLPVDLCATKPFSALSYPQSSSSRPSLSAVRLRLLLHGALVREAGGGVLCWRVRRCGAACWCGSRGADGFEGGRGRRQSAGWCHGKGASTDTAGQEQEQKQQDKGEGGTCCEQPETS